MSNRALALRQLFAVPGIIKCAGAHNAAGARVAEMAGFDAIWSSSFEISASYCVPDSSVLSMSEHLHAAQSIANSVAIPVIADCDTGYGNATNVTYAVKRFESAGIAGISIEDQVFPKANSLLQGTQQLVPILEFQNKIDAAKRAQSNPQFMVIARVQALIAGLGQSEAQLRATEYAAAGADAILMHWNQSSAEPIQRFLEEWTQEVPVVLIPTTYYTSSFRQWDALGAKMVIYANHGIRSALAAMEATFRTILDEGASTSVEESVWPVERIFRELQRVKSSHEPGRLPQFHPRTNE
jgi:phosphoenolpyruvate phosphomutase